MFLSPLDWTVHWITLNHTLIYAHIHVFIHSYIQQIFFEYLLSDRPCSKHCENITEQNKQAFPS